MSVEDAEQDDIYADANGKLWRIKSVYREPTVEAEEVEGTLNDPNTPTYPMLSAVGQAAMAATMNPRATIVKRSQRGFMISSMWVGWQRIFRRTQVAPTAPVEPAS